MGIFKTLNVFDIIYYDDKPIYPETGVDLRSSLLQVEMTNMERVVNIYMDQVDKVKPGNKFVNEPRHIKYEVRRKHS